MDSPASDWTLGQGGRLPMAPSLFIGPASCNASNASIVRPAAAGASDRPPEPHGQPLYRQRSRRSDGPGDGTVSTHTTGVEAGLEWKEARPLQRNSTNTTCTGQAPVHRQRDQEQPSTEAIWAEMQNTLEEVELSATAGAHAFRSGHSRALGELRTAQIALAQAWARSEAESEGKTASAHDRLPLGAASNVLQTDADREHKSAFGAVPDASATTAAVPTAGATAAGRPRSGTDTSTKSQLERDTENDIQLARRRREANDAYFQRVNAGVLDVVARLADVARAMKGVEQESKDIWGGVESIGPDDLETR